MTWKSKILKTISTFIARLIILKYKPIVIAITGNVGKSSTKEAIALVLSKKFSIRKNELNYNNEIGVALTIIGVEQSGSSSIMV
jgi:UDP-N-acetylmuramoyl-tripeptide--D-alanyl-D-alanine ligase